LKKWLHALKRKGFVPTKYSKVCGNHFEESDFEYQPGFKNKRLKKNAVPSIFSGFPDHLKKKPRKGRTTRIFREPVSTFSEYDEYLEIGKVFLCIEEGEQKVN